MTFVYGGFIKETMKRDKLAKKIRDAREDKDWTQAKLAAETELSIRTINAIERGRGCNLRTLKAIADALGISLINEE